MVLSFIINEHDINIFISKDLSVVCQGYFTSLANNTYAPIH